MNPEQRRPLRRVAIVGGAWTRRLAPYDDPSWEIWAFSSLKVRTPRITRWFEMHAPGDLRSQLRRDTRKRYSYGTYVLFLQELSCPVYMQEAYAWVPGSVRYPLEEAVAAFGRCFTSTASYMIALAILEGASELGLWGIHLTHRTVYARQRPGVEYLLALARRHGVRITLPRSSPLRIPAEPKPVRTRVLYGYDWQHPGAWWRKGVTARRPVSRTTRRRPTGRRRRALAG